MKHSVAWIERSKTQDACRLGENRAGFCSAQPATRRQSRILRHAILIGFLRSRSVIGSEPETTAFRAGLGEAGYVVSIMDFIRASG
jgi:hypothetical protein